MTSGIKFYSFLLGRYGGVNPSSAAGLPFRAVSPEKSEKIGKLCVCRINPLTFSAVFLRTPVHSSSFLSRENIKPTQKYGQSVYNDEEMKVFRC